MPEGADGPKRKGHPVLWAVIGIVVVALVVVGYRARMGQKAGAAGRGRGAGGFAGMGGPLPVVARAAQKGSINVVLTGLGTVTPAATVTVRTQISGQLVQINFAEGQNVKQGDLLAVIDPRPYEAALKQAQGQLQQAQAQLTEAQIDLDRYVTLSAQDSISKQQVDAERALVSQYDGMTKTDQAAVDNAQLNLTYCHITAPITGRVGLRLVDQGNYVTPGDASGLVILTQITPITVIFPLAEDYIPAVQKRIHSGTKIQTDAYDRTGLKKLASGSLETIDNTVDTTTGQVRLRAVFTNEDEALFPNQFVTIKMLLDTEKGVTVIPTSAVERGQQGNFVYLVGEDSKVTARTVTLGDTEGERVAVVSGVVPGDKVVVDGADRLKEGMAVLVQGAARTGGASGSGGAGGSWAGKGSGTGTGGGWGGSGGGGGSWGGKPAAPADDSAKPAAEPKSDSAPAKPAPGGSN
jgi:multidrug efflux system membrane fusion protein